MNVYQQYIDSIIEKIYKEVKPIIDNINNLKICPKCGGSFLNYTCKQCHSESKELKIEIIKLNSLLKRFNEYLLNIPIKNIRANILFNLLYSLKGIEIDEVNNFLKRYNYQSSINKVYERSIKRIKQGENVWVSDLNTIETIIATSYKDLDVFVDYFIYHLIKTPLNDAIYSPMIERESMKDLIKYWVEKQIKVYYPNPHCEFVPLKELNKVKTNNIIVGDNDKDSIRLTLEELNYLYMYGSNALLLTIFHELRHTYQDARVFTGKDISLENMIMSMDKILSQFITGYYDENYDVISYEIDAEYFGKQGQLNMLKKLGIEVPKEENIQEKLTELQREFYNDIRMVNGYKERLEPLFWDTIYDKPFILKYYPQLKYLAKIENGEVVKKSNEELRRDLEKLTSETKINALYQNYLIRQK